MHFAQFQGEGATLGHTSMKSHSRVQIKVVCQVMRIHNRQSINNQPRFDYTPEFFIW